MAVSAGRSLRPRDCGAGNLLGLLNRPTQFDLECARAWRTWSCLRGECGEPKPWRGRTEAEAREVIAVRVYDRDPRWRELCRRRATGAGLRGGATRVWPQFAREGQETRREETRSGHLR